MKPSALRIALMLVLLPASVALAQNDPFQRGFDPVPVKATPAQDSGIALEGATPLARKSWRAELLFDSTFGILGLKLGDQKLGNLIPYRVDARLLFAYQIHERIELGVDLPFTILQGDNFSLLRARGFPNEPGVAAVGLDDIRIQPRAFIFNPKTFPIGLAAIVEVRIPTGAERSFLGESSVVVAPRLAVERTFGPVRILGNIGYRFRGPGQYLNLYVASEFALGGGVQLHLPPFWKFTKVDATGEMHFATQTAAPFSFANADSFKSPWELLVGARGRFYKNWSLELNLGRGIGLTSGYGREEFRAMLGLRLDSEYADRDHDGIPDDVDKCPDVPEDKDGFQDDDGCPEPDNDNDNIPDIEDACPNEPGARELDGCPDRDADDVPDNVDKCPDKPGPAENDGCPYDSPPFVILESDRIRIRGNINFETGSARIQRQSYPILDEVADVLKKHPEVGPVQVDGHTDNRGARAYNQDLSNRRAKSVEDYLVHKGIDRARLRHRGYGLEKPVATNDTALGRAKNRRVEFTLVKAGEEKEAPPAPTGSTDSAAPAAPAAAADTASTPATSAPAATPDAGTPPAAKPAAKPKAKDTKPKKKAASSKSLPN